MGLLRETARRIATRMSPGIVCRACGRERSRTVRLVAGPGFYLCELCIVAAAGDQTVTHATCSFCGSRKSVALVGERTTVRVCANCTARMVELLSVG